MYRYWIAAVLAIAIATPSANAARHKKAPPTETVSGTLAQTANGNPNGCANVPFASTCVSGDCVCMTYDGNAAGALGQGNATIYLDVDINDPTSSPKGCYPVYASVQFANHTIGVTGAACGPAAQDSFPGGTLQTTGNYVTASNTPAAGTVTGSFVTGNSGTISLTLTPPEK